MGFDHISGLLNCMELLLYLWCQFLAMAINLENPMLDHPEDMFCILRIDITRHGFQESIFLIIQVVTLFDGER